MTVNISAGLVKDLRERTGVGMMECKKALQETSGDIDKAILWLRERGLSRAAAKATRAASQGMVDTFIGDGGRSAIAIEINCETDFVANGDEFKKITGEIARAALAANKEDTDSINSLKLISTGRTVKESLAEMVARIGENIQFRRAKIVTCLDGVIAGYVHAGGKIGTLVAISGGNDDAAMITAKDVAMHVAATSPRYLTSLDVPASEIETEKELSRKKMLDEKKPPEIIEKILTGQMQKFFKEICLFDQPFVKNPDLSVSKYVSTISPNYKLNSFVRFGLGEGIEKKVTDFAAEVEAQLKK